MTSEMTDEEQADAEALAGQVLDQARRAGRQPTDDLRREQWKQVIETVDEIYRRYDGAGMVLLIYGLADTLALHQWGGQVPPDDEEVVVVVRPLWVTPGGQMLDNADQVPPPMRWVGRLVAARAASDRETCEALLIACDEQEFQFAVIALIDTVATTLNVIHGAPE